MKKFRILTSVLVCCLSLRRALLIEVKKERITNGTVSLMTLYPFVVSIVFHASHKCGGSILSKSWVLTAAHCCYFNGEEVPDTIMQISVGNVYWQDGEYYRIEKKFVHENYNAERLINDVALLKIKTPIKFGLSVSPILLYSGKINVSVDTPDATVMGWGLFTDAKGQVMTTPSKQLQHVNVRVVPLEECGKIYGDVSIKNLCVFGGDSKGSCQGDSGGPLVMNIPKTMQIGVLSYGADCSNTLPEVYSSVYAFYSWIKGVIRQERPVGRNRIVVS